MKNNIQKKVELFITPKIIYIIFLFFILSIIFSLYILTGYKYSPDSFDYLYFANIHTRSVFMARD